MNKQSSKANIVLNTLLLSASLLLCLLFSEIYCRYFWDVYWPSPTSIHQFDPVLGYFHRENYSTVRKSVCFEGEMFTNEYGMINTPPLPDAHEKQEGIRIAILGDSFFRGAEALPGGDTAAFLRKMIVKSIVMNFSVSGYGTAQAFLCYKARVRQFKPDFVILGLLPHNDIDDNHPCIGSPKPVPYAKFKNEGFEIIPPANPTAKLFYPIHSFLLEISATYSTIYNILHRHGFDYFTNTNKGNEPDQAGCGEAPWPGRTSSLGVFRSEPEPVWEEAWEITEKLILELKKAVEADGGIFILSILTGPDEVDPTSMDRLKKKYENLPGDLDFNYPTNRLIKFVRSKNIHTVPLLSVFVLYRNNYYLKAPFFSYRCNGHWNPLGHYLAATSLVRYLSENGMLHFSDVSRSYRERMSRHEMWTKPVELLGDAGFRQIYIDGIFQGLAQ